jgi:hypothetical protein
MNWHIPNTDPYVDLAMAFVLYALQDILRWSVENVKTIGVITIFLGCAKVQALKSKSVVDDKIITYFQQLFTFQWVVKLIAWLQKLRQGRSDGIQKECPEGLASTEKKDVPALNTPDQTLDSEADSGVRITRKPL